MSDEAREFNVNDFVMVRLTDMGREILRKQHEELLRRVPKLGEFNAPKEDADGWSRWQMWNLMETFGPHVSLGMHVPFETTIRIVFRPTETGASS